MMIKNVYVEEPIFLEDLKVRGFADLIIELDDGKVYLYDIKTINAWSYRMKFGRKKEKDPSIHQELQVAIYGVGVKRRFGRLDGMSLLYYNKDTSIIKEVDIDMSRLITAESYWKEIVKEHSLGLPNLRPNVSPVQEWECKYCMYKTQCDNDNRKEFTNE